MSMKMIVAHQRFRPLFWTQFFGALNDNVLKNALVVIVTFKSISLMGMDTGSLVALAGGLFILPFFLFSPLAGQISDKLEKSRLVRITKIWEAMIMALAALGFLSHHYSLLFAVLFLAGVQAALFGPVKYSLLPDLVSHDDLVEANAYVETGTFLAILIGTIAGGVLVSLDHAEIWLSITLLALSGLGLCAAYRLPAVPPAAPELRIELNPAPMMRQMFSILNQSRAIFNSVLAISWFWFFGAAVLSLLPVYVKDYLGGSEHVVTCFLAMFTIGIGGGSFLCEKLSFKRVEVGLVPIGSLGMTVFLIDLYFSRSPGLADPSHLQSLADFVRTPHGPRLLFDFAMMSVFGGFFILPLYTLIQERSRPDTRSRVIAGNNILNAIFMVVSSLTVIGFHGLHLTYPQIFLALALMNLAVAFYIYTMVPEFALRFLSWILARALYRLRATGLENIPKQGGAILVCNHVSYVDWLIIAGLSPRPVRFIMNYKFFDVPILKALMKQAEVIPIAGAKEDPELLKRAYDQVSAELRDGKIVCIFLDRQITREGELKEFKTGVEKMVTRDPVPVIPMALKGRASPEVPRRWLNPVELNVGKPVPPSELREHWPPKLWFS